MNLSLGYIVLVFAIYVLSVARLTRLINFDKLATPLRMWPARRSALEYQAADELVDSGKDAAWDLHTRRGDRWDLVAYLLGCPWCIGFWLCLFTAIAPVLIIGWPWWALFPVALAASHIIGLLAPLSEDEDIEIVADKPNA